MQKYILALLATIKSICLAVNTIQPASTRKVTRTRKHDAERKTTVTLPCFAGITITYVIYFVVFNN